MVAQEAWVCGVGASCMSQAVEVGVTYVIAPTAWWMVVGELIRRAIFSGVTYVSTMVPQIPLLPLLISLPPHIKSTTTFFVAATAARTISTPAVTSSTSTTDLAVVTPILTVTVVVENESVVLLCFLRSIIPPFCRRTFCAGSPGRKKIDLAISDQLLVPYPNCGLNVVTSERGNRSAEGTTLKLVITTGVSDGTSGVVGFVSWGLRILLQSNFLVKASELIKDRLVFALRILSLFHEHIFFTTPPCGRNQPSRLWNA